MEKYRKIWRPTRTRTPKPGYLKVPNTNEVASELQSLRDKEVVPIPQV